MRRVGGGRKPLIETDPGLLTDLNALIEPDARGDPMSPLRWTCKSLRRLAGELREIGHKISHTVVGELLKAQKFSLQANSKTREGADNPDRDAQFGFINQAVKTAMADHQPVILVDTKRRSWSAISAQSKRFVARTPAVSGVHKAIRRKCGCTTS